MATLLTRLPQASRAATLAATAFFAFLFVPAAKGQTPGDYVQSLLHQKLLLLHVGEHWRTKVKKDKLRGLAGKCDVAVQIKKATWDRGTVRLEFEVIGMPEMGGKSS